jgi:signal transduction histidine kinase
VTDLSLARPLAGVRQRWSALTLARRFALAGGAVLVAGMLAIGFWVTRQIEEGVTRNTAVATALYVDSVIAPLLLDLKQNAVLSPGAKRALDETLTQGALGRRLSVFKIWAQGGLIAYSNEPGLTGRRFPLTESLREAWGGSVATEFNDLSDEENAAERSAGVPLLEIYSPIREPWSGKVVAVAEFYEIASDLQDALQTVRLRSWAVVAFVTLCMMGLLSGIVMHGSDIIVAQRQALEERVAELSGLLARNEALRARVLEASRRVAALNERYLRRISADLHDGPAQLLGLALLRLGRSDTPAGETEAIRGHLEEAMRDIRNICRGLALPQVERLDLAQLLRSVVAAHEQRTGVSVRLGLPSRSPALSLSEKICVYRFAQEGLNNGFHHAGGLGQSVSAQASDSGLQVAVADEGPGFGEHSSDGEGLGLAGLRERIESLGGSFRIETSASGTRLEMALKLTAEEGG